MRSPLRSVTVTYNPSQRAILFAKLRALADHFRFAIRLSTDPARPGATFVQLYRSDIKMIGEAPADVPRLGLTIFRTLQRVPSEAVDQGVGILRRLAVELLNGGFQQVVFEDGDDMALEPWAGKGPVRSTRFSHADGTQDEIKQQLAQFAKNNGFALRFRQISPDPKEIVADLYTEGLNITVDRAFSNEKMNVFIYRAGDGSTSDAGINHTFAALRGALEEIPGVSFPPQP